jgi:hypothetical protein
MEFVSQVITITAASAAKTAKIQFHQQFVHRVQSYYKNQPASYP